MLYLSCLSVGGIWVQCASHVSSTSCEDGFEGITQSPLTNHLGLKEFEED